MISNYNPKKQYLGLILFLSFFASSFGQNLLSDKNDYYPGELATFTGSGFTPNELVEIVVLHHDETPNTGENHEHWEVQTDENGSFTTTWIVCTDDCLGSTLRAYATGLSSNLQAWVEFTDANTSMNLTSPANAFQGDNINLIAKLTSNPGSVNVANKNIKFYLNNVLLGQSTTNSLGEATFSFICNQAIATYNGTNGLKAVFEGDPSNNPYAGSNKANNFEIKTPVCVIPVITCPSNIAANSEANSCGKEISLTATATGTNPTITYKIGSTPISSSHIFPFGTTTVTATAINLCGSSSCNFTVTVDDITAPVPPVLENSTGECSANVPTPIANDICVGNVTGTTSDPLSYTSQGTFTVNWTFDDGNGNVSYASQSVIIDDITAPEAPVLENVTGECSANVPTPIANDICVGNVTGTTSDPLSYNSQGTFTVNWTFDDGNGNISYASQTVIVDDVTAPIVPTLSNITGECSATVSIPTATDNCVGNVLGTTSDPLSYTSQGTYIVNWSFDDGNGNVSYASQSVIIDDVTAPEAPVLENITGECSANVPTPIANDICVGNVTGTTSDPLSYTSQGTFTVNWTFDDGNGNISYASQTVIVDDVTAPIVPTLSNITGECSATVSIPTATDNCVGNVLGTTSEPLSYTSQGTYTVNWSFDDGNGNVSYASQTVIIDDITAPVPPVLENSTGECSASVTAPTAVDVCVGNVTGTTSDPLSYTSQGTYTVNWTFDDGNGNVSYASQTVIVDDVTAPVAPVLENVTGECSANVPTPIANDICVGNVTGTTSDPLSYTSQGTYTVNWTFDDGNGNVSYASQTVIVDDVTAPIVPTLSNITEECSATVSIPTATDNCVGNVTGTTSDPLSYTLQGTYTVNWSFDDGNGNISYASQSVIIDDITAPTIICPSNELNLTTDLGTCSKSLSIAEIGIATANDNCLNPIISWTRSDNSSNIDDPFSLGITTITWKAIDVGNNQITCSQTIEVTKIAPTLLVSTSVSSQQYSDLVNFYAQLSTCNGYPTSGAVTFKLGTTILGVANVNSSGYAELLNIPMLFQPNNYVVTAEYNGVLPYLATSGTSNLTITCEDAFAYYTGSSYVSTSSATSSNATVTLSATIKDISDVDNTDTNFGNITNAKVTFINRDNNTVIAANIPIGLVTFSDTKVGTATYNWNTSISGDSQSITIGVIVTGYYCRNSADDNSIVTISKPLGDLFITGGGYLTLSNSSGIKAGTTGTKNNYGFNVKYNKNKTNLQGNINTIIRRMESDGIMHVYQIKGNSMTSLSVITTCPKKAVFVGKANIQDITNPLNSIAIDGNATLQVTMTDNGEPGNYDKIGITVWNKNGGLWFSSNWNGTSTVEQTITGGNLKVHGGSNCGNSPIVNNTNGPATNKNTVEESIVLEKPEFTIWPNPSNSEFNLEMSNKIENQDINIEIFDQNGRLIQKSTSVNEKLNFGLNLQSGLYFIKITHGSFQETKRVVKN